MSSTPGKADTPLPTRGDQVRDDPQGAGEGGDQATCVVSMDSVATG
jgi:hypothetical protein